MANPYAIKPVPLGQIDGFGFGREKIATKRKKHSRAVDVAVWKKYHYRCNICEEHTEFDGGEVDHIISLAKGGSDTPSNWQWLCHRCNNLKGSKRTNAQVKKLLGIKVYGKKKRKRKKAKTKKERGMFDEPQLPRVELPKIEF